MTRLDRQGFLGPNSERDLKQTILTVVGLGGGGSHVSQQAAHVGYGRVQLIDPDIIELSNLNRLVGGTVADVKAKRAKVDIARRLALGVSPDTVVDAIRAPWQSHAARIMRSDVVISCLDSVQAKADLESVCRRALVPMIDIGMDVHSIGDRFLISGQVALSTAPGPCLRCMGIVTEKSLGDEAQRYGAAGSHPQVVWPNGLLASSAVGLATQLVAPWYDRTSHSTYLEYDGNLGTLRQSDRLDVVRDLVCPHHPAVETGQFFFDIRQPPDTDQTSSAGRLGRAMRSGKARLRAAKKSSR